MRRFAWLVLVCVGCRSSAAPSDQTAWPEWPRTRAAATALVTRETRRVAAPPVAPPTAEELLARLRTANRTGRLIGGWDAIVEALQAQQDAALSAGRSNFLLFGTHHDAALQVDAFRRLIGPLGLRGLTAATVEPFPADGRWTGIDADCQRGDTEALAVYRERGERAQLEALRRAQIEHDYAAWKYGFADELVELALDARASGVRLLGCDVSPCLAQRTWGVDTEESLRVRELHCWLALRSALAGGDQARAVAMLWGQAHVGSAGVQRFLEPSAQVVSVAIVGGRRSQHALEVELAGRLVLTEPVLLVGAESHTLLLPDAQLEGRAERAHDRSAVAAERVGELSLWSHAPVVVELGDASLPVDESPTRIHARAGRQTFVVASGQRLLVASVSVPEGGSAEIEIDVEARHVTTTLRSLTRPP